MPHPPHALALEIETGISRCASKAMRNHIVLRPEAGACLNPILALVEDWMRSPGGFPQHPHRGFETVTLVLEGRIEHRDTTGRRSTLGPGDVQWMTAGAGVLHSEMPSGTDEAHTLQLWLNLPAAEKARAPRYQELPGKRIPVVHRAGAEMRVVSGDFGGATGPAENVVPTTILDASLEPGATVALPVAAGRRGLIYLLDGELRVDGRGVASGQSVRLCAGEASTLELTASRAARCLVVLAEALDEPVVARGPFVMNSEAEITRAFDDLRTGRFLG